MSKALIYSTIPVELSANALAVTTVTMGTGGVFYCEEIRVQGGGKFLSEEEAICSILVRDANGPWFNTFVHKNLVNGWKPSISRRVLPGAVITIEITNLALKPNTVQVALMGYENENEKV